MQIIFFAVLVGTAAAAHLNIYDDDNKIIGGSECLPHSQPWQVAFTNKDGILSCGGSLIDEWWIVSAAHCNNSILIAHLGEHDKAVEEGTEQHIWVAKFFPHEEYDSSTTDNDIMLVKLVEPAMLNDNVWPIMISQKRPIPGTSCLVSGWGNTRTIEVEYPEKLQCLEVPILSSAQCKLSYPVLTSNMFCAGYTDGGKDSCQGDSGGPLVCNGELTGVVSWGMKCAVKSSPGVYTKVSQYNAWIKDIIANN